MAELWYPSATRDAFPSSPPVATQVWRRLLCSHTSSVNACAAHPRKPHVYASGGAAGQVYLWHAGRRAPLGGGPIATAGGAVTALAFAADGAHLAVGLACGAVDVRDRGRRRVRRVAVCDGRVAALQYAPASAGGAAVLAVGGGDCSVTLLAAASGYRVCGRCRGHAAAVIQLDFSADGAVLRSVCSACEVRGPSLVCSSLCYPGTWVPASVMHGCVSGPWLLLMTGGGGLPEAPQVHGQFTPAPLAQALWYCRRSRVPAFT